MVTNLWDVSYDSLARTDMPVETSQVDYVDHVAALIAGNEVVVAQLVLGTAVRRVNG